MNIEEILQQECWIVDIFPQRVPKSAAERYARIEQFYLSEPQIGQLRRTQADALLRLSCYYEMHISFDYGENEIELPEPQAFMDMVLDCVEEKCLYIRLNSSDCLIVVDGCDTYMTVYAPDPEQLALMEVFASSCGLFMWKA